MISQNDTPQVTTTPVADASKTLEYLIIGAGPAGLQMGFYFEKAGRDYAILERGPRAGHFFEAYPRHRTLISINKVHTGFDDPEVNLRWDWNSLLSDHDDAMSFKHFSREYFPQADVLVRYLGEFAARYALRVSYGTEVTRVSRDASGFLVSTAGGPSYRAAHIIVATGLFKPYLPDIPGIGLAEPYTEMPTDPEDFAGQRVLILGKGNSAFETANHLIGATSLTHVASPHPLKFAWRTHHVGHVRSINSIFFDSYLLKAQNALIDGHITKIERKDGSLVATVAYAHADGEVEEIAYDRVLACTGFRFDTSLFDPSCRPDLAINDRFPAQTCEWESTSVPGLHFAGTLTQMRDFKKKQSGFIHGFRYNCQLLFRILEEKNAGVPLAPRTFPADPAALTAHMIFRADNNSSMWQQTGFFCDALVAPSGAGEVRYYEDLSVDYAHQRFADCDRYFLMTMEFGQERIDSLPDVFKVPRVHKSNYRQAELSTAIHPVVRQYCKGQLVSTHHVIEDFASLFHEDVHVEPLAEYLSAQFDYIGDPSPITDPRHLGATESTPA